MQDKVKLAIAMILVIGSEWCRLLCLGRQSDDRSDHLASSQGWWLAPRWRVLHCRGQASTFYAFAQESVVERSEGRVADSQGSASRRPEYVFAFVVIMAIFLWTRRWSGSCTLVWVEALKELMMSVKWE
jgi:protein-S-isoprenylcysteine O-methyltransferase Ste14